VGPVGIVIDEEHARPFVARRRRVARSTCFAAHDRPLCG
jgi:hypothetical protein